MKEGERKANLDAVELVASTEQVLKYSREVLSVLVTPSGTGESVLCRLADRWVLLRTWVPFQRRPCSALTRFIPSSATAARLLLSFGLHQTTTAWLPDSLRHGPDASGRPCQESHITSNSHSPITVGVRAAKLQCGSPSA